VSFLAAGGVAFDPERLRAALRRALFVLAAGGDPHRALAPGAPAVASLARELDDVERRAELARALAALERESAGLTAVAAALAGLRADEDLAWRWLACALLADAVDEEDA
jgi:hypothetical protein